MQAKQVKYIDYDELKVLWRMLERLRADVEPGSGSYIWNPKERDALITVMDAVKDTSLMLPMSDAEQTS
jgi:hypothetical protein